MSIFYLPYPQQHCIFFQFALVWLRVAGARTRRRVLGLQAQGSNYQILASVNQWFRRLSAIGFASGECRAGFFFIPRARC